MRNCGSELRIVGWIVGWEFRLCAANFFRMMVARDGVEPLPCIDNIGSC